MKKKPGSQPLRCAIYARTATVKKPDEDNSITEQVEGANASPKKKIGSLAMISSSLILDCPD
jgi:hypothetical protein